MSRITLPVLAIAAAAMVVGCDGEPAGKEQSRLVLTGSSTVAPLVSEIGRRFEARHPGTRIDVQTGGSSRGIADARTGLADLGMISRELAPDERDLTAFPIALDGIGLIVHEDNGQERLTRDQVITLFRGEIERWSGLGGADEPVTVVTKADGRATLQVFCEHFGLDSREIAADVVIGDNLQAVKTVAGNRGAVAYVSIGLAELEAAAGAAIRLLPVGDAEPTTESVATGAYPLLRRLHLVSRDEPDGLARAFIDFSRSPDVHDLVHAQQLVPATE